MGGGAAGGGNAAGGRNAAGAGMGVAATGRASFTIWLLAAITLFWFYPGGDPNQSSRMLLVEAIALRGVPHVDHDHGRTIDKGEHRGHYYSDKAPGISLLAVPAYAAFRAAESLTGLPHDARTVARARVHAITFLLAGLPALGAAMLLARALRRLGSTEVRSLVLACGFLFGTLLFPYGTMLYGHALAAMLLMAMFVVVFEWDAHADRAERVKRATGLGALAGAAFVVEYPTALPSMVILSFAVVRAGLGSKTRPDADALRRAAKMAGLVAAGAVLPLLVHGAFAAWAFGSPLALPYKFVIEPLFRAHTSEGLFGVGRPVPSAVYGALFSPYRGLFFLCPLTALAFAGYGAWLSDRKHAAFAWLSIAVTACGLAFAVSYYAWDGGLATGSRHLVPYCAFLILPLGPLLERSARWRSSAGALAVVSSLMMFLTVVTSAHHPEEDPYRGNPIHSIVLPSLLRGELNIHFGDALDGMPRGDGSYDLATLFGAPTWLAIALPIVAWTLAWTWVVARRSQPDAERA